VPKDEEGSHLFPKLNHFWDKIRKPGTWQNYWGWIVEQRKPGIPLHTPLWKGLWYQCTQGLR